MARQKLSYESRVDAAKKKISEKPQRALNEVGKFLVKEIRAATPKSINKRHIKTKGGELKEIKPGRLKKSFSYWKRKKEGDLIIGSKAFYAQFIELGDSNHSKQPFFLPTVEKNIPAIQEMIAEALKELERE